MWNHLRRNISLARFPPVDLNEQAIFTAHIKVECFRVDFTVITFRPCTKTVESVKVVEFN